MLKTCPQCLKRVLPRDDNTCPACRGAFDESAAEPHLSLITLRSGMKFPDLCFRCGKSPAGDHVMVKISGKASTEQVAGRFFLLRAFGFLFGSGAAARVSAGVNIAADSFRIDVPACAGCRSTAVEEFLRGSSLTARTIRIAAHPAFCGAVQTSA